MKPYTKTGDKGTTSLIGGTRVPKYDTRIEAYGTVDELMAYTGMVYDNVIDESDKDVILEIQDRLMTCSSILALESTNKDIKLPQIIEDDIIYLEKEMDKINDTIPPITKFILPGGHVSVSFCHIARTICRRAERLAIKVNEKESNSNMVIKYLNRLSDYYFVLSRKLTFQLKIDEIPWIPRT